jgi:general stress protein YciG
MNPSHKPRGLTTLPPERRREIASLGGKAIPSEKRAFSVDRELAKRAGHKGTLVAQARLRERKARIKEDDARRRRERDA